MGPWASGFCKWHLSVKGPIWGFSVSLPARREGRSYLKPTPSLFLGDPLSAGAVRSLPTSITLWVGLQHPSHWAAQGVSSSLSLVWVIPGDAAPLRCHPGPALWLTFSFCLQVYGAHSLVNPASTGASVKLFPTGQRCASKYGGARGFSSPPTKVLTCMLTLL